MTVSELTAWLRTMGAVEVQKVFDEVEIDHFHRHREIMNNLQRLRLMQLRLAEEVRALDYPTLADALVPWILKLKVTCHLAKNFVCGESPQALREAIPLILDEIARHVIEQQNRLHVVEAGIQEEEADEEDEDLS